MGLFSMFRGDQGERLTPHLIFATSLVYMMSADGAIDNEEIGQFLLVIGGEANEQGIDVGANNRVLLDRAIAIARTTKLAAFLSDAAPLLSDAQKMCILVNLLDSSLADGQPTADEQMVFEQFLDAFGISEERFRPFFEVIVLKNDRSIFFDMNHPSNRPGYTVRLTT